MRGVLRVATLALAAVAAGCGTSDEANTLPLFERMAYLRVRLNAAYLRQDPREVDEISAEIKRLVAQNFEVVAGALSVPDLARQADAAFALGFSDSPEAILPLLEASRHPEVAVRSNAIASLGMLGFPQIPVLRFKELLEDPVPAVREAALFGLRPLVGRKPEDADLLARVHKRLDDPSKEVRNEALILLRKLRSPDSLKEILRGSLSDPEPLIRAQAASTLGALEKGALDANPHLVEMLRDEDPKVVQAAHAALKTINGKDLDPSYDTWRGWLEEELRTDYVCPEHPEVSERAPGKCPRTGCAQKLERIPRDLVPRTKGPPVVYACPDHPDVVVESRSRCAKGGCGKELIPRRDAPIPFVCTDHPDVQTYTPTRCGRPGCGKELVLRRMEGPYACPDHPDAMSDKAGTCPKAGCGKDLVPRK